MGGFPLQDQLAKDSPLCNSFHSLTICFLHISAILSYLHKGHFPKNFSEHWEQTVYLNSNLFIKHILGACYVSFHELY